jgi:uncharacterized tellurite resistance protein B-like protein
LPQVTYARLKQNIALEEVHGDVVAVTFHCPVTGKLFHAVATMRPPVIAPLPPGKGGTELHTHARRGFRGLLRGVFAAAVVDEATARKRSRHLPGATAVYYDHTSRETAVVEAFETLATNFAWDEARQAFVEAEVMHNTLSGFDMQLQSHPLLNKWERVMAARMLAEIVAADGKVTSAEREFFKSFLSTDTGTLDELIQQGRVSKMELEETRPAARATMLMLAYGVAMCDERLDAREQNILARLAKGLGVALDREEQIRHWACEKVVENMLSGCYADGKLDDDERKRISKLAHGIGINEALVAKIDVRIRKRG